MRNGPGGRDLRKRWTHRAQELDRRGHFAKYFPRQREKILRKGFLGLWSPDQAIAIAKTEAEEGRAVRTAKFNDEMRDVFGRVGEEVREALLAILEELPPECYEPPAELEEPPGCPFVFNSRTLGREVYFKFQVKGTAKRRQVLFWSCHPPGC